MSKYSRLLLLAVVAGLLPACSSEMTRFSYPVMGMKQPPVQERQRSYDRSYEKSYDRSYDQDRLQSYKNQYQYNDRGRYQDYQPDRRDYSRSRYNPPYKYQNQRRYNERDVYDTSSTDNADKNKGLNKRGYNAYSRNEIDRDQLPQISEKKKLDRPLYGQDRGQLYADENRYKPQRLAGNMAHKPALDDPYGRHVVSGGDTLYNISRRYNVQTEDVRRLNDLQSNDIKLGQQLYIPGLGKQTSRRDAQRTSSLGKDGLHRVEKGDTIYNLSRRYNVTREDLAAANGISDMGQLQLGQKIVIPGKGKKTPVQVASIDKRAGVKALSDRNTPLPRKKPAEQSKHKIKAVDSGARKTLAGAPKFLWPARGKILSGFGRQKSGTINDGVNLALPAGTLVKAAGDGVVAYAGNELKGYGNLILIRHDNNWVTAYAHNQRLMVKRGEKVRRGQAIAKSGKTGSVHQPQLHFELRKGSKPVNPVKYLAMR